MATQYKLLKDLPNIKKGSIFVYNFENASHPNFYIAGQDHKYSTFIDFPEQLLKDNPDWFEEIKELEKVEKPNPLLQFRNRASVKELEKETTYWYIIDLIEKQVGEDKWTGSDFDFDNLAKQNCFLGYMAIDLALDNILIYNQIYKRIKEIDFENDFVCDWSNQDQYKYFVRSEHFAEYGRDASCTTTIQSQGTIYMSKQAKDWLLSDEVTIDDFKIFIEY